MFILDKATFETHLPGSTPLIKFVSIKDPHMNFGFRQNVRFNHDVELRAKHQWVRDFMLQHDVPNLIMTGDVFDDNQEKKWSFQQYLANKRELQKYTFEGIKLCSPLGNHDMFNGFEGSENTVFGELVSEGVLKNLTTDPLYVSDNTNNYIQVQGFDYEKNIDTVKRKMQVFGESTGAQLKIAVLHSHCTPKEIAHTDFTYEEMIKDIPGIDMFICGHYHGGFPTQVFVKTDAVTKQPGDQHAVIVNNWSFQRLVRDHYNQMDIHVPEMEYVQIAWSEAYQNFICYTETHKIPCVKYNDAFKPKAVELLKVTKKESFKFFSEINLEDIPTGNDDIEIINKLAKDEKINPEVVSKAIEYLNNALD